ncbi:MAG TPA: DUF3039 domain-containing protein [Marmoricola sp.]|nr:DUF3039 domain-containing protein [Marmoricola sp.]HNN47761.1 DUF3039 domain-containing protein [Marmoricola sp.]HNO38909.1 DUF3039 domain-containing protein [Marmoricola sp.]
MAQRNPIGFGTGVLEDTRVDERLTPTEDGDHERLSHYVPKDKLMEGMINGTPVVALCGKVWIPSRDPEKFPVCPECKEIWEGLRKDDE